MKLKSFFADTVEQALSQARREMGPEAMLIHSKPTNPESKHLGAYEVVVYGDKPAAVKKKNFEAGSTVPGNLKISEDISALRRQVERLARSLARSGNSVAAIASSPVLADVYARLIDAELDPDLVLDAVGNVRAEQGTPDFKAELGRLVQIDSGLGTAGSPSKVVALVGPPGAGKTSCLVKLAVQYGVAARRSTLLLGIDNLRVGASDELRSYASILGVGCETLDNTAALARALAEHGKKELILIDTPGLASEDWEGYEDLVQFLAQQTGIDVHLVLPLSMRAADLRSVADRYLAFGPRKLLFTRLDETGTFGPVLNLSARTGLPVSFLSTGRRVPEDLEPAQWGKLFERLLGSSAHREPGNKGVAAA